MTASRSIVVVQRGDTLSAIAQRHLGDALLWPRLARLNRLRNPDKIKPGQWIEIPPESEPLLKTDRESQLTKFEVPSFGHWMCRLIGRHVRYTIIGQTCSEPEWTNCCELCDYSGDFFIPTPADEQRFGMTPKKGWFL